MEVFVKLDVDDTIKNINVLDQIVVDEDVTWNSDLFEKRLDAQKLVWKKLKDMESMIK